MKIWENCLILSRPIEISRKKGIFFKDVLELVQEPEVFRELILKMSSSRIIRDCQAILSVDARGFIFGSAIALQTSKPMIFARKAGKLPGEVINQTYELCKNDMFPFLAEEPTVV